MAKYKIGRIEIRLTTKDIVSIVGDAIVNASNTRLYLGHGVSGAIKKAAGKGLQQEMFSLAPIPELGIAETGSYGLKTVRRILHVPTRSGEATVIYQAYVNVLERAREQRFRRVGMPSLGTGRGALHPRESAELLVKAVVEHEEKPRDDHPGPLELILAIPGSFAFDAYKQVLEKA